MHAAPNNTNIKISSQKLVVLGFWTSHEISEGFFAWYDVVIEQLSIVSRPQSVTVIFKPGYLHKCPCFSAPTSTLKNNNKKSAKRNMQVLRLAQLGCISSAVPNTPWPSKVQPKSLWPTPVKLGLAHLVLVQSSFFSIPVVFVCFMSSLYVQCRKWFFNCAHANSISCHNVTYPFPFFAHSVSDLWREQSSVR